MQRWDIINNLIKQNEYQSYLEIGYYKGWSFDKVKAFEKVAVDPNPSKTPVQEMLSYGTTLSFPDNNEKIVKMTSDDFFSQNKEKFDIIFIDGLHEYNQVYNDIQHSLKYLNNNGTIVLHDCNPPSYQHTTEGGVDGNWTGDTYRAVLKFQMEHQDGSYTYFTHNCDWGVGIIRKNHNPIVTLHKLDYQRAIDEWAYFDENREKLLNLKI